MTKIRSTDSSGIDDRRGSGGGGGGLGGLGSVLGGGGMKVGGGLIGVLVLLAALILPRVLGGGSGDTSVVGGNGATGGQSADAADGTCSSELEQIVCGGANDVQAFWGNELPAAFGVPYHPGTTTFCTWWPSSWATMYCVARSPGAPNWSCSCTRKSRSMYSRSSAGQ